MRPVASLLLLGVALTAGAAEVWRWTDANGVVHFADHPVPGAERVNVAPPPRAPEAPAQPAAPASQAAAPAAPASRAEPAGYTSCGVSSPAHDQTFQGVQSVEVRLNLQPALRPGHFIQVYVDGAQRSDWPSESLEYTLPEVFRGTHTVQARVLDEGGAVVCSGPSVTFHLRQQSVLAPGGRPPPQQLPRPRPLPSVPGA